MSLRLFSQRRLFLRSHFLKVEMGMASFSLGKQCLAEVIGTFILVFFGCGAVHAAVLTGAKSGLWQVAIVWGGAIMTAPSVLGGRIGARVRPANTFAPAS